MKYLYLFLTLFILTFSTSCKKNQNEQDQHKTKLLKDSITSLQSEISTLKSELKTLKKKVDDFNNFNNNDLSKKKYREIENKINKDTLELIRQVKYTFHLSEYNDIMRSLTNNWEGIDGQTFLSSPKWRSSTFMNSFFSEQIIDLITIYLKKNNLYKTSKTNVLIDALIDTYETIDQNDDELLEELYRLSEIGYNKKNEEIRNVLEQLPDLDKDIFENEFENYVSGMYTDFTLYSFWARRKNEQNKKETYQILKKIQLKMNETSGNNGYK